jgi:hypothetical protein
MAVRVELDYVARIDRFKSEISKIPGITETQVGRAAKAFEAGLKKMEADTGKASRGMRQSLDLLGLDKLGERMIQAGQAVWNMTDAIMQSRLEVSNFAAGTGLTVDQVDNLMDATKRSGVEWEKLDGYLRKVQRQGGDVEEALATIGVKMEGLDAITGQFGGDTGPKAIAAAEQWRSATENLNGALEKAQSDLVGLLNLGPKVDAFALGFVYSWNVAANTLDLMTTNAAYALKALDALRSGDTKGATEAFESIKSGGEFFAEVADESNKATQSWVDATSALDKLGAEIDEEKLRTNEYAQARKEANAEDRAAAKVDTDLERVIGSLNDELAKSLDPLAQVDYEYQKQLDAINALIQAGGDLEKAEQAAVLAEQVRAEARSEVLAEQREDEAKAWQAALDDFTAIQDAEQAKMEETARLAEKLSQDRIGWELASAGAGIDAVAALAEAVQDGQKKQSKAYKAAALVAYAANKASALLSIGMNTAEAVTKAIALFGPPPSPPGIAAMTSAYVIGGLQAAAVLATDPPEFPAGGMVRPPSPDHYSVGVEPGEAVLSRQGVRSVGGEQGVAAANSGQAGGPVTIPIVFRGRVIDRIISETVRNPGSRTSTSLGLGGAVGVVDYYR